MTETEKITKAKLKRDAIIAYVTDYCRHSSKTIAVEKAAKEFFLSESRIWQILRDAI